MHQNQNSDNFIRDAIAIERGGEIALVIPEQMDLPLDKVGLGMNGEFISLFVRPGSPDDGLMIAGLAEEPLQRIRTQKSVVVAEIKSNGEFGRIFNIQRF